MSYSWFRKMFKKYTGLSTQYQLQIRIQKAKEFLTSSSMPIKEISDILEFDSVNYFISFFKKKTSESPSEFRNRVHNSPKK
jgi:AraC-like DNA-binding protein